MSISLGKYLASSDAWHLQRLSPDGTETLVDHHSATFDAWLRELFMSLSPSSLSHYYYLAVVTLLDQLNPKEYNWECVSVILRSRLPSTELLDLFDWIKADVEFSRILSKFLMDRERAGFLWVNPQRYVDLTRKILGFLRDK